MVTTIFFLQGPGSFAKSENYKNSQEFCIRYIGERSALKTDYPSVIGFTCEFTESDRKAIKAYVETQQLVPIFGNIYDTKDQKADELTFCDVFDFVPKTND